MPVTEDRFGRVVQAAQRNIRTALDLIAIHSEQDVRGPQPRASLNPFTVLAAVGSWERFIADLTSAASQADSDWFGPGGHKHNSGSHWPPAVDRHLIRHGLLTENVTSRWEVKFPTSWIGVAPRGWQTVRHDATTQDRGALLAYLAETRRTRNGAAHFTLVQGALEAADSDGWYPWWKSDADNPSLQSGYVRGVTAVYLQIIDCTAALIAQAHGWDPEQHRLPVDWFSSASRSPRYSGVQFWGGAALHRYGPS